MVLGSTAFTGEEKQEKTTIKATINFILWVNIVPPLLKNKKENYLLRHLILYTMPIHLSMI